MWHLTDLVFLAVSYFSTQGARCLFYRTGGAGGVIIAAYAAEHVPTDKNMRASKEYRSLLVKVLTRRAWEEIGGRAE